MGTSTCGGLGAKVGVDPRVGGWGSTLTGGDGEPSVKPIDHVHPRPGPGATVPTTNGVIQHVRRIL